MTSSNSDISVRDGIKETAHLDSPATESPPKSNRSALLIVFLVVFIDLLGFGIVLPMLPVIADTYVTAVLGNDGSAVVKGMIVGLLMASFSLMQFMFAPGWGRLVGSRGPASRF